MVKKIQGYETDDGETFTRREDAERHEAVIAVRAWLGADQPLDADSLVGLIESDPEGARRVLAPLMPVRRPREAKAAKPKKATVAEYEKLLAKDAA